MTGRSKRPTMTAEEFMAELERDPEYRRMRAERDAERDRRDRELAAAEAPVVADLRRAGFEVESAWGLSTSDDRYLNVLPILMDHLVRGDYPDRIREGIARAFAARPAAMYWEQLRDLYVQARGPDESEGLAAALAASATPDHLDALIDLMQDGTLDHNRIHLVRAVLRVGGRRGREVVDAARADPVLGIEARAATKGLRSRSH